MSEDSTHDNRQGEQARVDDAHAHIRDAIDHLNEIRVADCNETELGAVVDTLDNRHQADEAFAARSGFDALERYGDHSPDEKDETDDASGFRIEGADGRHIGSRLGVREAIERARTLHDENPEHAPYAVREETEKKYFSQLGRTVYRSDEPAPGGLR